MNLLIFRLKGGKWINMASRTAKKKTTAEATASRMRRKGYNASVYKKKKGYGVSVTRK